MGETSPESIQSLCVAIGIGLLIGAERERKKGSGSSRNAAGIRTFTVVSMAGAVAGLIANEWLLSMTLLAMATLVAIAYLRSVGDDPGLTTESALLLTFLLGSLSVKEIYLAASLGVTLSGLLASRDWLHQFVKRILSERELHDVIIFFALLLVILPIAPDQYFGPYQSINLHQIAKFVVMVVGISSLSYVLKRLLGSRGGLPMGGFLGGFVSSTAVVMKMGQLAKTRPNYTWVAIAAGCISNASTLIQLQIVLAVSTHGIRTGILYPSVYGLLANLILFWLYMKQARGEDHPGQDRNTGSAFDLKSSIGFALMVTGLNLASAALYDGLGHGGVWLTSALAGFTDAHANISSIAALHDKGDITMAQVEMAAMLAYTTNAISKMMVALIFGNRMYQIYTLGGIVWVVGVTWLGVWIHWRE